jgi:hypothetical protein
MDWNPATAPFNRRWEPALLAGVCGLLSACAASHERSIDKVLALCETLASPDAEKADGEVWFWFQKERAVVSRTLWTDSGRRVIARRLSTADNEVDRNCLSRLHAEAVRGEIVRE